MRTVTPGQAGGHQNPLHCPGPERPGQGEGQLQPEAGKPPGSCGPPGPPSPSTASRLRRFRPGKLLKARSSGSRAPRQASRTGSRSSALPASCAAPALPPHAPPPACSPAQVLRLPPPSPRGPRLQAAPMCRQPTRWLPVDGQPRRMAYLTSATSTARTAA